MVVTSRATWPPSSVGAILECLKYWRGGYAAYHAVPTNTRAVAAFRYHVMDLWRRVLQRRSQRDGSTWTRVAKLAEAFLPKPRILHPWPSVRFAVKHPRWEPSARIGPARICAGGAQ